jgi:DNA-binding CsgD family transcriptional regulator
MSTGAESKQFIEQACRLVGSSLDASRLAFYFVDADQNPYEFTRWHVPFAYHNTWISDMHRVDPLHIRRIAGCANGVACIEAAEDYMSGDDIAVYRKFLRRFDVVDTIELLFREQGRVAAAMSVMWTTRDRKPCAATLRQAKNLQEFIEFTLQACCVGGARTQAVSRGDFGLTEREAEIADLVCRGLENAEIARSLDIGLATVKTHLIHLFRKVSVKNRAAMVARLIPRG